MQEKITAIVLAAGRGTRMGSAVKKQYMDLKGKPLLYYSLKAFEESEVDTIVLVTDSSDIDYCNREIVQKYGITKVCAVVPGGSERYLSVLEGLKASPPCDYVLIHDSARPFVSRSLIKNIIEGVKRYGAVLPAVPTKDTIKVVDTEGKVEATPDRTSIYLAQTPQAFSFAGIMKANENMLEHPIPGVEITDDAMIMECYGDTPMHIIMGDYDNIKVTTPGDMPLAVAIMERGIE